MTNRAALDPHAPAGMLGRVAPWAIPALLALWAGAILIGMACMIAYTARPGNAPKAPDVWPSGARIEREPDALTLVMFIHPRCPCSRATIHELERALVGQQRGGRVRVHVFFTLPTGLEPSPSELRDLASAIPGVQVHDDPGCREAARFGASTSGTALLYGPSGRLRFCGGITGARGHEGDNPGRDRLCAAIGSSAGSVAEAPVFGCPLNDATVAQVCPECEP